MSTPSSQPPPLPSTGPKLEVSTTPLPGDENPPVGKEVNQPGEPDVYDKFSPHRKSIIVAIVSFAALLAPISSSCFLPSIPQISSDLNSTPTTINYTIAIFLISLGLAPLIWAPLSGFYGRRAVYLASIPVFVAASVGVANCQTVGALIGTRVLQGIGSSSVLAVGAGTVGDIYRPTERARAMGWFYSGVLLGPTIAPVFAGVFQEYTELRWRSMQYFLTGLGALSLIAVIFLLPETSHGKTPHTIACEERGVRFVAYWFNPLKSVLLLRWLNICLISINSSFVLLTTYCVLVPLSIILKERYDIQNYAIQGCIFLVPGVGNIIGTRVAGVMADRVVAKWIKIRGFRRPEDRLRTSVIGAAVVLPASMIIYGWVVEFDKGGIGLALVLLLVNGFALLQVLGPNNVYLVDSMQQRSAEVIAINNFIRYLFSAAATAAVLPMQDSIGVGWTNTVAAGLSLLGFACMMLVLYRGAQWREEANVRYGVTYKEADEVAVSVSAPGSEVSLEGRGEEEKGVGMESDRLGELVRPPQVRRTTGTGTGTKGQLPQVSVLLSRTQSLTEGHH